MIALTLAKKYWKLLAVVGALMVAFVAGRATAKPPPPAVEQSTTHHAQIDTTQATDTLAHQQEVKSEGPVVIKTHTVYKTVNVPVPGPAGATLPCPAEVTQDVEEDHGPTETHTSTDTAKQAQSDEHVVTQDTSILKITPPSNKPSWAVGVSVEDPLQSKMLRLQVDHRLFGSFWVTAGATPGNLQWDVGLKFEF